MSLESLASKYKVTPSVSNKTTGLTGLAGLANKYGVKSSRKADLTTSEGLYNVAEATGGAVAKRAKEITGEEPTTFSKIEGGLKRGLGNTLDIIQRPNYAIASGIKNVIDTNPNTTFEGGLESGITGQTKHTFTDVLEEGGWKPETRGGKIAKGVTGFALDVLLDPTTYVTFGAGAGVKVGMKVGEKTVTRTLSKEGVKLLQKGVAQKSGQVFGEQFVKDAISRMAEKSPEMYKKFIDQGGIKFFGNSLISGGRIAGVVDKIPGMTKLDEASQPIRNALGSLFSRNISAKFGKLPNEYIQLQQKFLDLGKVKSQEALDNVINIARENKLTADEAGIISNAIENKLPLSDNRLENARKLIEQGLGRNLKAEQKVGINVGDLPNYVPHMLLDTKIKNIPFKPSGARVSLGMGNERGIKKFTSETGEEFIGTAGQLGLKDTPNIRGLAQNITSGQYKSLNDIEKAVGEFGYKIRFKPQDTVHRSSLGYFDPTKKEIVIASANRSLEDVISTLKHEITHSAHFQMGGLVDVMETFANRGSKISKQLKDVKNFAREEWQGILKAMNVGDVTKMTPHFRNYYKQPTELLARAIQAMIKNPEQARKLFPKTMASLEGLQNTDKLFSILKTGVDNSGMSMSGKVLQNKSGEFFNETQATINEINSAFGKDFFDPNIVNTAAIRSVASSRAVAAKEFLTEAAQKFGTKAETAPTGYIEVGAKELKGLKFHPAIAEQIDKFGKRFIEDEGTNKMLKAFDDVQNLWKASVTSIFPAFHGRNAISNVFLNYLDLGKAALSPARHALATTMLNQNSNAAKLEKLILRGGNTAKDAQKELDVLLNRPVLTDDFGKKWTFGEMRKEIKERNVAFGDEFTGFLDIRDTIKDKLSTATTGASKLQKINPFSQQNIAFKTGRKVGNAIEQQARILNFMTNLEKTGDVVTAAERTKQFLFDYTNLSDFEKNVLRRLIPFYTFTRKNLELQVSQLAKQPGKLATQAKLFTAISKTASGGKLTEEETKGLPEYLQEGLGIVWDRKGDKVTMINSIGTPVEQVFSAVKDNTLLGSLSPVIAVPLQIVIGKHFFFDRDLKDVDDATPYKNAPQFIKDYIGFATRKSKDGTKRYIALNPTRLFLLNNIPPSSRVVQTIGQLQDENVSGKLKILRQLTGLKPYGVNLTDQQAYQEKAKMRELQDLLDKSGVAPVFKRSFIPKK